jgi:hypothetical protein
MDYHIALFYQIDDMFIPKEKILDKMTKSEDDMKIMLEDDINDLIAIMCTHGGEAMVRSCKDSSQKYARR